MKRANLNSGFIKVVRAMGSCDHILVTNQCSPAEVSLWVSRIGQKGHLNYVQTSVYIIIFNHDLSNKTYILR